MEMRNNRENAVLRPKNIHGEKIKDWLIEKLNDIILFGK